jgi:hypothetical protein
MRGAANLTSAMEVAADLRQRILLGELKPGARLKIDDVASLCDVSHMPSASRSRCSKPRACSTCIRIAAR